MRIGDEDSVSFGQDCVVRTVPAHGQRLSDPRDGEVLDHDRDQRPPQATPGQLRAGFSCGGGVLTPGEGAVGAAVAADADVQGGRSPSQRDVGQAADDGADGPAMAAAAAAPVVCLGDTAVQNRAVGFETLAHDGQTEVVQAGEGRQVRGGEGSVGHVEVFRSGCVRTPILEGLGPLPGQRRARRPTSPLHPRS
jgi:hypothetical protein